MARPAARTSSRGSSRNPSPQARSVSTFASSRRCASALNVPPRRRPQTGVSTRYPQQRRQFTGFPSYGSPAVDNSSSARTTSSRGRKRAKKFTEPVAFSSTTPTNLWLPPTALGDSFGLLTLRARCTWNVSAGRRSRQAPGRQELPHFANVPRSAGHVASPHGRRARGGLGRGDRPSTRASSQVIARRSTRTSRRRQPSGIRRTHRSYAAVRSSTPCGTRDLPAARPPATWTRRIR